MNTGVRDATIKAIWRGESTMDIVKIIVARFDMVPGGHEEREVGLQVARLRTEIENLVRDLPDKIEKALREGFSWQQVREVIDEQNGHLIPNFNLDALIGRVAGKIAKEKEAEQDAIEKKEHDAKMAAIQAQIDGALANLRKMGVEL